MSNRTPQQLLYNEVFKQLQGYGIEVIDSTELGQSITYPFFVVTKRNAEKFNYTLDSFGGGLVIDVDVWSKGNDVGRHDELVYFADDMLSRIEDLNGYHVSIDRINANTLINKEEGNQNLLHTSIIAEYKSY
ncbi:hypothetical protein [Staphylococcus hominis]|uniref:hypothetical protein n=1 Tax=Staphylococcus hominis TaxID=1290 RepID=UPI0011A57E67|nr:hypothetical protein [Staphylococcus hominis]MCI2913943.1 hypothetical protein [Staphylococcus hominis]WHI79037.1 hypothetical protein PYH62_09685 [Staphylococcus hominis]